jgi:hypothetical protein
MSYEPILFDRLPPAAVAERIARLTDAGLPAEIAEQLRAALRGSTWMVGDDEGRRRRLRRAYKSARSDVAAFVRVAQMTKPGGRVRGGVARTGLAPALAELDAQMAEFTVPVVRGRWGRG